MIDLINTLSTSNFNLATCIFVVVFACLVVALAIIQIYYNCSMSKYLIFKKQKPADKVFIINTIALVLFIIIASLMSAFCSNEERYFPYALILWILSAILLGLILYYFVYNLRFNKQKFNVNQFLDINYQTIKSNFGLDGLSIENKDYFFKKNNRFDDELINDYNQIIKNLSEYEKNNNAIDEMIADVIVFEEKYCACFSLRKRKFVFALFLDLADQIKKVSIKKIKK